MRGETEALHSFRGLDYVNVFDLFLEVMHDPDHTKHEATKRAWERNYTKFQEQGSMVATLFGNLVPVLMAADEDYAEKFAKGAEFITKKIDPDDYLQPLATWVNGDGIGRQVGWFHALADADCDGVTNQEELQAISPNALPVFAEDGTVKEGTGVDQTDEQRKEFVSEALGPDNSCCTLDGAPLLRR